jgi:hypothetical protein
MVAVTQKTEIEKSPLDALAAADFGGDTSTNGAMPPAPSPGEDKQAAMLKKVIEGVSTLALAALKAVRARLAVSLPEIKDEWTDEALKAPADALVPVLQRYAGDLTEVLGQHPEVMILLISCVPLGMGYVTAQSKHDAAISRAPKTDVPYTVDAS